jgi:hypothetical protein
MGLYTRFRALWADGEAGGTPITAAALNYIEDGIVAASDHGQLAGLADDDHPQYLLRTDASAAYEPLATELFIPAGRFSVTNGGPSLFVVSGHPAWFMDAGTLEAVSVTFGRGEIPSNWATYSIEIWWANTAATAGDVLWQLGTTTPKGEGDSLAIDSSVAVSAASAAGVGVVRVAPVAGTRDVPPATKPLGLIRILRDAAGGGDTLGNDAAFLGVRLVKAT